MGGRKGGGVVLTPFGKDLVKRYRSAHARIESVARGELGPLLKQAKARRRKAPRRTRSVKK